MKHRRYVDSESNATIFFSLVCVGLMTSLALYALSLALSPAQEYDIALASTFAIALPAQGSYGFTEAAHKQRVITMVAEPSRVGLPEPQYTEREVAMLAKTAWGESRGCTPDEQRLVLWTIFQRVDYPYKWGDTIECVITQPDQFHGYSPWHPICPYIYTIVREELEKWQRGEAPPTLYPFAPTLPYFFFCGDGTHNWFRAQW